MRIDYILLGENIRKHRKGEKLSQSALAELVNVSVSYISRIECGKNHVSLGLLVNICEVLGTTLAEVMTGNQGNFPKEYLTEFTQIMNGCTADDKRLLIEICSYIKNALEKRSGC